MVESLPDREHLRIEFPKLDGYRVEIPDEPLIFDAATTSRFLIGPSSVPTYTDLSGVVGQQETVSDDAARKRAQHVAYVLAERLLRHPALMTSAGDARLWDFPWLVEICRDWMVNQGPVVVD
jgi:type III restriction enzyme